jgi:hypothetical protein
VLRLFAGDDWAEDHHDVELMDAEGRVLARGRLPEGVAGMARLHAMVAGLAGDGGPGEVEVLVGIETDRGPARGVSADQHPPAQVARQLRQRQPGCLDVVGDGVGPRRSRPAA